LYLKQYFTPTMIHKFVKTTPNPSATKNSSGELVGPPPPPPPPPPLPLLVLEGGADETVDMLEFCRSMRP
jgi:hypothetical protein